MRNLKEKGLIPHYFVILHYLKGDMVTFKHISIVILLLAGCILPLPGNSIRANTKAASNDFIVVIDAGHGDHDAGALGQFTNEKSINLGVARKLGKMLSARKGFKVVYTRTSDRFVTLQGRCDIANKAGGDLFVSIHTNSLDKKSPKRTTIKGASVYTLGLKRSDENLAVAMRENSVMKLENDYSTTYAGFDPTSSESYIIFELSQNKHMEQSISAAHKVQRELVKAGRADRGVRQANFWVLFKTAMPSMLVELDFISNPTVEKYLASEKGQTELAAAIFRGICAYRGNTGATDTDSFEDLGILSYDDEEENAEPKIEKAQKTPATPTRKTPAKKESAATSKSPVYKIQFLVSDRKLPANSKKFKGLSPVEYYQENGTYKYTFGRYNSQTEAAPDLRTVKKLFKDAFVITTDGKNRIKQQ